MGKRRKKHKILLSHTCSDRIKNTQHSDAMSSPNGVLIYSRYIFLRRWWYCCAAAAEKTEAHGVLVIRFDDDFDDDEDKHVNRNDI